MAPLSDAERAVLTAQLAEAKASLHKATVGGSRVQSRYGDQEIRNSEVDRDALRVYIAELEGKLGIGGRVGGRRVST